MLGLTAKFTVYLKTEKKLTVDKTTVFLTFMDKVSLRMPVWYESQYQFIPTNSEAVTDLKRVLLNSGRSDQSLTYFKNGIEFIKIHVDFMQDDLHTTHRQNMCDLYGRPGDYYDSTFMSEIYPCLSNHSIEVCKCHLPLIHVGQDESIFKNYQISGKQWTYNGITKLNKKGEGEGQMVSAFVDEYRGYGFPGTEYLDYGVNREGYWDCHQFGKQLYNIMLCLESLYPGHQMLFEADNSSGHNKSKDDGLVVSKMNLKWGGGQPELRESVMSPGDLGDNPGRSLQEGDIQYMQFQDNDPRPFYDPNAIQFDRQETELEVNKRIEKKKKRKPNMSEEDLVKAIIPRIIEGYIGKPKGIIQILYERGLYKFDMKGSLTKQEIDRRLLEGKDLLDPSLDAPAVLSKCKDFQSICHPELAGVGIEYCWGKAKFEFRKNNDT